MPEDYLYDLNFLLGNKYDLRQENFRSLDEFFTKDEVAKYCFEAFINFLKLHKINWQNYIFIEPSCGDLSFYNLLPENKIGIDLNAKNNFILRKNFLDFLPEKNFEKCGNKKFLILGNPPFGLRGNLALRFLNHAAKFADFVGFILPPLFDSDGKGSPKKRVKNLSLVHSERLPINSFIYPNGREVEVSTIFQIWVKNELLKN